MRKFTLLPRLIYIAAFAFFVLHFSVHGIIIASNPGTSVKGDGFFVEMIDVYVAPPSDDTFTALTDEAREQAEIRAKNAANNFSGGSGTQQDPWLIATAEDLNSIRNFLGATHADKYFKQTAAIDLGIAPLNEGLGWLPIGTSTANSFRGNYDGQNFPISNLFINRPTLDGVGLFGFANGATIKEVRLENVDITGNQRVAALLGRIDGGLVEDCSSTGIVRGNNFTAGLIANLYFNSTVRRSFSHANVFAIEASINFQQYAGLVARALQGHIEQCFATGRIEGGMFTGGLVGLSTDANNAPNTLSTITDSYATGFVYGESVVGGLAGELIATTVTNTYSVAYVAGPTSGGLVGRITGELVSVSSSYWNREMSTQTTSAAGEMRTLVQMVQQSNYIGWDFDNVWEMYTNLFFPWHQYQLEPGDHNQSPAVLPPSNLTATPGDGMVNLAWETSGSLLTPDQYNIYRNNILIASVPNSQFQYSDQDIDNYVVNAYYLTGVIGIEESNPSNQVEIFATPGFIAGSGSEEDPYQISTAGELFTLRLYLDSHFIQTGDIDLTSLSKNNLTGWDPIGNATFPFTGVFDGGGFSISNLYINRPTVGNTGLFGVAVGATFKDVRLIDVNVESWNRTGALCGYIANTVVENCLVTGDVHGRANWTGGLAGNSVNASEIMGSVSLANVTSLGFSTGGLTGTLEGGSQFSNSYASGSVSGTNYIGGLVGWLGSASTISSSYATGHVAAAQTGGGLVGGGDNNTSANNSFYNTKTSGVTGSFVGEGRTTVQMVREMTFPDWNFADTWRIHENVSYPYLAWQNQTFEENIATGIFQITFKVNMVNAQNFNPAADAVFITGNFYTNWPTPGSDQANQTLTRVGDSMVWTRVLPLEPGSYAYKYFLNDGWDNGEWQGTPDRIVEVTQNKVVNNFWGSPTDQDFTNVENITDQFAINVYPNPVNSTLWLQFSNLQKPIKISLVNMLGKVVDQVEVTNTGTFSLQLDLQNHSNGIYLLHILDETGINSVRKIIKR